MVVSFDKRTSNLYAEYVISYYQEYRLTTEVHIDTLILLYRFTGNEVIFNILFELHYGLLLKITRMTFNRYRSYLYSEDYNDMLAMVFGEFYRRVLHYDIPPKAPFSKYVKLYIRRWLNTYTKIIVKKNNRFILDCDREVNHDKFAH